MGLDLRPYQKEAVAAIEQATRRGVRRPLLGLPTGTGKTVIFGTVIARRGGRGLVLAHPDELLAQATQKIRQITPEARLGLVKAERKRGRGQALLDAVEELQVRRARELGWSWQQIAAPLGVSKQAVHQKYGKGERRLRRSLR